MAKRSYVSDDILRGDDYSSATSLSSPINYAGTVKDEPIVLTSTPDGNRTREILIESQIADTNTANRSIYIWEV